MTTGLPETAHELLALLVDGQISAVEVVSNALERAEETQPDLNAFVTIAPDYALDAARRADTAIVRGEPLGPLHGIPISVKDLIPVAGLRQTAGSRTMSDVVADRDAVAVERAVRAGACIVGKTTTSEFGTMGVGISPLTGITRNPWDLRRNTGGSSAGAAASVAAGVTPIAIGTDGGGSSRIPAALCGTFGLKAQFGRIPVYPTVATPTLSHVGVLSRNVRDATLTLEALAGYDHRDPHSLPLPVPAVSAALDAPLDGLRAAWSPTLGYGRNSAEVDEACRDAVAAFAALGCEVTEVEQVFRRDPIAMLEAEYYAGVGTRFRSTLEARADELHPTVARSLAAALEVPLVDYYQTVFDRYELRTELHSVFEDYDLLLCPTVPVVAFAADAEAPDELPERDWMSWMTYTYPFNLCGNPAASVPCGWGPSGLPVGLQIIGPTFGEEAVISAAAAFERVRPWASRQPIVCRRWQSET